MPNVLPQAAQPAGQPLRTLKIQIPRGLNILFPLPLFLFPKGFELMRPSARPMCCIIGGILLLFARPAPAQTAPDIDVDGRPPKVAPLFEQPGVLTPRGTYVLEPAVQYAYSSSDRIAIAGYALIATLLMPRVDVRDVRRNSTIASLTARRGITNRFEVELRVPYVYRSDAAVIREGTGDGATNRIADASGKAIGDAELAARYQLNEGGPHTPYFVAGLRFKSRTGRDPFEVTTDCITRCSGPGAAGTGLQRDLPTGSGFYALEPNIAWFMPSRPVTFFGTFSYMHNFKRSNLSRKIVNGESEFLGEITPPDSFGFNAGVGFALNEKTTVSIGYDHIAITRAKQNGRTLPDSLRTQLGTLMAGFSYRLDPHRTINVAIGAGLTRDAPDIGLTVRLPFAF
jgi:opacity protein-like surface antigen